MKTNYYNGKHFQAWDVIENIIRDQKGVNAFNAGNVIKYLLRYDAKGQALSDLNKAKHYMDTLVFDEGDGCSMIPFNLIEYITDYRRHKTSKEWLIFSNTMYHLLHAILENNNELLEDAKDYMIKLIQEVSKNEKN